MKAGGAHIPVVLLVEDDGRLRERLARAFEDRGWRAFAAATPAAARAVAEEQVVDLAVVDLRLGEHSGMEAVAGLHAADAETVILVLTGYGSISTAIAALRAGAADYLTKPADVDQLVAAYEKAKTGGAGGAAGAGGALPQVSAASLDQVEWDHIQRVMADCAGNITHAAKVLGVHRRSLQRKLAKRPLPNG